jgi:class 3 adenylate cyclase/tetratricopeptide (TPR) repeat protein
MSDIQTWLEKNGLGKYAAEFIAQDVTPDLLPELSDADLRELGLASLGDRKRLLKAVVADRPAPIASTSIPAARPAEPAFDAKVSVVSNDEGERRHATIMFSDLTGYTALNEAFDPEEVEEIMARIKTEASAVIERHGGRVNQFVGDEVMALFGIPVARRDDPRRAVSAALELHAVVDGIAAGLSDRLGRVLSMHTGIQTGLVIARRSDSRSGDYTLTGDTVNTAARLRGLARPGEVVVSPQTWQQVSDYFEAEAGQAVEVKGKERPLVPYRILKPRAVPTGASRPLVGRADEMQQFMTLSEACLNRQRGRVIFVRGDPGLGKSRLVAEFLHVAREQGLNCHATAILDFGARTGRDALRMLVQSLMGLAPDADEASRGEAILELAANGADDAQYVPFLYAMVDVEPPAQVRTLLSAIDVQARRKASMDTLCHLVGKLVSAAPTLLLIEDIHWADPWMLAPLGAVAALAARRPLLVIMSTRFAGDPSVGEWRTALHGLPVTSIDLGPLASDDAMRLAAGAASMSETLLRSCVERAEGNPLFLEQLLLNAGDEGSTSLPGSIQALIQARMDRLAPADKGALQAAAVWGPRVPLHAIRHLVADPAYDSRVLVEQFLLRPEGDELVFSHTLFRDGAYGSLLHARRRQLHLLAAEWIEPRDVALAAEHFERAEDGRAPQAYLRASEAMAKDFQYVQALDLVERGLKLAAGSDHGFPLKLARARLLLEIGRSAEAITAGEDAVEAARDGGERALGLITVASGMRIVDRPEEGLAVLARAQPLAERAGLTLELARLHELRGNLLFALGKTVECQHAHERALDLARQAGSAEAEAAALGGIGDACYAQGRIRTGYRLVKECVELAKNQGFLRVEVAYLQMLGWSSLYMMDGRGAVETAREALALATRISSRRGELLARGQLALVDGWVRGNWREMASEVGPGLDLARALGSPRFEAMGWFMRSLLAIRSGEMQLARRNLDTAFEISGERGMYFNGPQLYGTLARIETDPVKRLQALAKGEELLAGGHLSLNFCIFYDAAIEVSLTHEEWGEADRYCGLLETYAAPEPFPWSDFVVARGRAITRVGRGEIGAALVATLQGLHRQALDAEDDLHLARLETALQQLAA